MMGRAEYLCAKGRDGEGLGAAARRPSGIYELKTNGYKISVDTHCTLGWVSIGRYIRGAFV